jgi:hypothetical protein
MFVRFRQSRRRLQCSLIETRRTDGKVRHEHVAGLGAVPIDPSIADRIAFWSVLHQRLGELSNRFSHETHGKLIGQIHARIPMPTADEQRQLQKENAEADERLWSSLHDMSASAAADHKDLIATRRTPSLRTRPRRPMPRQKLSRPTPRSKEARTCTVGSAGR